MIESSDIEISVESTFIGYQQNAEKQQMFVFSYTVDIQNHCSQSIQLMNRFWLITNGDGEKVEVSGEGVVGEQPVIAPGDSYQYTSAALLKTAVGNMQGHYEFDIGAEQYVKAKIPVFRLALPNSVH